MAKAILTQNKLINYAIVIVGANCDTMEDIDTFFLDTPGFLEISDTICTDKNGCWHMLVNVKKFHAACRHIMKNLKEWMRTIPEEMRDTLPFHFPLPQVNKKFGNDDDDDSSSGQDSYMLSCKQSYASVDKTSESNEQYY
jgi:hypothetical protein